MAAIGDSITLPPAMASLPRDARGYPIFWTAFVAPDGTPDFRVLEMPRVVRALKERRCGMCGQKIAGNAVCLIGCEDDLEWLRSTDPPMHEECARYALAVCPFLSRTQARRSGRVLPESVGQDAFVQMRMSEMRERAPRMGIFFTRWYDRQWRGEIKGFRYARPFRVEWLEDVS